MSDVIERARGLSASILSHRAAMDAHRRMPPPLAAALANVGVFKMLVPRDFAGGEVAPADFVAAIETLAACDAATAWVAMIGATSGLLAAYLPAQQANEIFAPSDAIVTGVFAPTGRAHVAGDQLRVDGRWKWNSGGSVSTWLGGGCLIHEGEKPRITGAGAPEHRMVLFPARDSTFIDTWHTAGLKGTGSGDMSVAGLLVPAERSVSLVDGRPCITRALYAFPLFGLLAVGIAAVASGNALGALADFKAMARERRLPNGRLFAERSSTTALFAEATAAIQSNRAYLQHAVAQAWHSAEVSGVIPTEKRAQLRLAATHMTRSAARVVRDLQDHAGGASVFLDDPLARRLADAQTMTAHMMIAPPTFDLAGGVLLGNKVDTRQL